MRSHELTHDRRARVNIDVLFHPIRGWFEPVYDLVVVDSDECTEDDKNCADDIVPYITNVQEGAATDEYDPIPSKSL